MEEGRELLGYGFGGCSEPRSYLPLAKILDVQAQGWQGSEKNPDA